MKQILGILTRYLDIFVSAALWSARIYETAHIPVCFGSRVEDAQVGQASKDTKDAKDADVYWAVSGAFITP